MEIKIGTKFSKQITKNRVDVFIVTDILTCFSEKEQKEVKKIYLVKGVNTLAQNEFEVSKTTIIRGKL